MIPNAKGFTNRFRIVKIPSVKSVFLRTGERPPIPTSADLEKLGGVFPPRKNDLADQIQELADQVPVHEPEED